MKLMINRWSKKHDVVIWCDDNFLYKNHECLLHHKLITTSWQFFCYCIFSKHATYIRKQKLVLLFSMFVCFYMKFSLSTMCRNFFSYWIKNCKKKFLHNQFPIFLLKLTFLLKVLTEKIIFYDCCWKVKMNMSEYFTFDISTINL